MITYFIIGILWTWFWEWFESTGLGDENFEPRQVDGISRLIHFIFWPLFLVLFIVGWLRGYFGDDEQ